MLLVVALVAMGMSYPTVVASSSPSTAFEITDANIVDSPAGKPFDWGGGVHPSGAPTAGGS
jgi:hypothetical protein